MNFLQRIFTRLTGLCSLFVALVSLAAVFNYAYYYTSNHEADVSQFTSELHHREAFARNYLQTMASHVQKQGLWSVTRNEEVYKVSEEHDMVFYIIDGDKFKFWSSQSVDVRSPGVIPYDEVFYLLAKDYHCMGVQFADKQYRYVALVKVKQNDHQGRNNMLNAYVKGFNLPASVYFSDISDPNAYRIKSIKGSYLFSLKKVPVFMPSNFIYGATVVVIALTLAVLLVIMLNIRSQVADGRLRRLWAILIYVSVLATALIASFMQWPDIVFSNKVFSPTFYASAFAPSLGHLALYTALVLFFFGGVYSLHFSAGFLRLSKFPVWLRTFMGLFLSLLFFVFVYNLSLNLIYSSTMDVAVSYIQDISFVTVSAIFLILLWTGIAIAFARICLFLFCDGTPLRLLLVCRVLLLTLLAVGIALLGSSSDWVAFAFFVVISVFSDIYFCYSHRLSLFFVSLMVFLCINQTVAISYVHCEERNMERYKMLADNLTDSQTMMADPLAEMLMPETSYYILHDKSLSVMVADTSADALERLQNYLQEKYFSGYYVRYELSVQVASGSDRLWVRRSSFGDKMRLSQSFVTSDCVPVHQSCFSLSSRSDLPLSYVGVFPVDDRKIYVMFYPNLNYGRVDFLEQMDRRLSQGQAMDVSTVKYYDNELLYMSGDYHYPNVATWVPNDKRTNFYFYSGDHIHFVARFAGDSGLVVVSKQNHRSYSYVIFVSYLCAIYVIGALLVTLVQSLFRLRRRSHRSIMGRMQAWFLVPLLLSFVVMGALSMIFFMDQFKRQQVSDLASRVGSIQQELQSEINMEMDFSTVDMKDFSQELKNLSSLFQVDIFVYNLDGGRVCSSRGGRKDGRLMIPQPKFFMYSDYFRPEQFHGVDFYSYSTRLYNRKNQFMGYIDVRSPSGAQKVKNEVFNLLVVLMDLYLVIIILAIIVTWGISRRLSKPISLLALKFKEVKLLGKNTKIEYKDDDELGLLVDQYNVMVDQLQQSADELAKSQREFAWRDMARRIAHEIKNPLTPMKLSVQMALRKKELDPDGFDEYFKKMSSTLIEQIDNLTRIASSFSTFAKTTITVREPVNLADKVKSVVSLFEHNDEGVTFSLNMNGVDEAMVWSDNQQILQVFNNLFRNAIQAIPDGREGHIDVDFSKTDTDVLISIKDNGCGIPPQNLETIFQPNFTTKTSGMGLGLSIVKTIINLSGGDISVESEVSVGTTFSIHIPLIKPGDENKV